jgi:hypothetical protein
MVSTEGLRNETEIFPSAEDARRVFLLRLRRCVESPEGVWSEGYLLSNFQRVDGRGRRLSVRHRWLVTERRRFWDAPGPNPAWLVWKRRPSDPVPDFDKDACEHWALGDEGRILITPHKVASNASEVAEED